MKNLDLATRSVAISLMVLFCLTTATLANEGKNTQSKKVRALLEEKLAILTKFHDIAEKNVRLSFANMPMLIRVKEKLVETQIALCQTKAERLQVLERMIKETKKLEEHVGKPGADDTIDLAPPRMMVQVFLIELRIALQEEKEK